MNKFYIASLKVARKSEKTIEGYTYNINKCLEYIGKADEEVTYLDLVDWLSSMSNLSSATVFIRVESVKSYFSFLHNAGVIDTNPAEKLDKPTVRNKAKEALTKDEIKSMLRYADSNRVKAIITMLSTTGLRVSELLSITMSEYADRQNNALTVIRKGNKEDTVYLSEQTIKAIDSYIRYERKSADSNKLFTSTTGKNLNTSMVDKMLKNCAKNAKISKNVSAHVFRHSFATISLQSGVDLKTVSEALNHSNISVTSKYLHTDEDRVCAVMTNMTL